jgi:hypothetical protein
MKNLFKLKAAIRVAGIIVIMAVIGFSMTACLSLFGPTKMDSPPTSAPSNFQARALTTTNGTLFFDGAQQVKFYTRQP